MLNIANAIGNVAPKTKNEVVEAVDKAVQGAKHIAKELKEQLSDVKDGSHGLARNIADENGYEQSRGEVSEKPLVYPEPGVQAQADIREEQSGYDGPEA